MNQKIAALQGKRKLRQDKATKRVFIDRIKSPIELTLEHNSLMLIKMMGGSGMRVAGNSRIVKVGDIRVPHNQNNVNQSSQANSGNPVAGDAGGKSTDGVAVQEANTTSTAAAGNTPSTVGAANQTPPPPPSDGSQQQLATVLAPPPSIVTSTDPVQNQGFSGITQGSVSSLVLQQHCLASPHHPRQRHCHRQLH